MRTALSHFTFRRRGLWLLWLALLLPLAQGVAAAHALAHVPAQLQQPAPGSGDDEPALTPGHCMLCLGAAALADGAPAGSSAQTQPCAARQAPPASLRVAQWLAPAPQAYRSRAPPR